MTAKAHAVNINNIPPLIGKDGVFRVVIHGNSGSGKSTLASRLGSILNVPVIYLDKLHWRPNWVEAPDEELVAELRGIIEEGVRNNTGWIVDGNGEGRTKRIMDFAATDIIWLDPPFYQYFPYIVLRTFRRVFRLESPCAPGCYETWREIFLPSQSILWWTITNHGRARRRYRPRYDAENVAQGGHWRRLGGFSEYDRWLELVRGFVKY